MKVPEPVKLPSGNYFIRLRLGGVSIPITESSATECKRQAQLIKAEYQANKRMITRTADITVAQAIDKYIESRRAGNKISDRTVAQYEYIKEQRFQSIMQMKISKVTKDVLQDAVDTELAKPSRKGGTVKTKTVKDAFNLVAAAIRKFNKQIETDVDFPETQRTFKFLPEPQDIFKAVKGTDVELPVLLAMWLSLSMSEIRGLTKSKSIHDGKLYIVETVVDINNVPTRKAGGKEENRPRALTVPAYIQNLIDAVDGDIIEPRSGHAVYMRFQKVLEKAGMQPMPFHDLRHVNASVMADLGIPTAVAQERGGWKTDTTMKRVYTQVFDQSRIDADNKMDEYFNAMTSEPKNQNVNENVNENIKSQ